ncbi:hypothetical protein I545_6793 [Mycobacterium kansasii 662]|uniref:Uncharacterized protein n=1 Tax=Mycobacterium kansasii 662 TaxID=1299326 RepID=X7XS35_MYCKA|nr:hypothetical protein I545_6793 [Mycobacterium kansasii 662]
MIGSQPYISEVWALASGLRKIHRRRCHKNHCDRLLTVQERVH